MLTGGVVCKKITFILHKKDSFFRYKGVLFKNKTEALKMKYKTVVIKYNPRAKKMAEEVEKTANEYAKEGWNLLTFSVTLSAKAILVFEKPDFTVIND